MRLLSVLLLISQFAVAQQNLVPNPSFEDYTACPSSHGQVDLANPWYILWGNSDFLHQCGDADFGVPQNEDGYQLANTGNGYTQVYVWSFLAPSFRDYIGVELISPLEAGKSYQAEFYVSRQDSLHYAVGNLGMHFSSIPHPANRDSLLGLQAQVIYEDSMPIIERDGWVKISGHYTAQGGEKYIAIGNFDADMVTQIQFVPDGPPKPVNHQDAAGYYIDDVAVYLDTTIGVNHKEGHSFSLYPNPSNGMVYIDYSNLASEAMLSIYDTQGRQIVERSLMGNTGKLMINENVFNNGIYFYQIISDNKIVKSGKMVINRSN